MEGFSVQQATVTDVDAIVALMHAAQDAGGIGLSQAMPHDLVRGFVEAMPCVVARRNGALIGAVLAQPKPEGDAAGPVTRAMLDAYPGDAAAYVYGPVAVAGEERGQGLAQIMASELMRLLPGREGILFVHAANEASLRAHAKIGAVVVADFEWNGRPFRVLAIGGGSTSN